MGTLDKPNLILPLAPTFNERDITGWTASFTNGRDQQKKNFFNEIAKNPLTQKGTLTLSKRPGITINPSAIGSVSGQAAYLVINNFGIATSFIQSNPIVFSRVTDLLTPTNDSVIASNVTSTVTILSGASVVSLYPAFVESTKIVSAVAEEKIVIQLRNLGSNESQRVFYATSLGSWIEIVDADFTALVHRGKMEHMDGYAFQLAATGQIFNSDLNTLASWSASNYVTKQASMDQSNGLAKLKNQIIAFGDDTAEVFYNAGNTTGSPLTRIPQLNDRVGLLPCPAWQTAGSRATNYYATIQNRIYFVGRRGGSVASSVGLFSYDGARFEKVSTGYIDKILSQYVNIFISVHSFGFHGQQAVAIELELGQWLMFFPDWKDWFVWTSSVFRPVNNGQWFLSVAMANQGRIYRFTGGNNWQDDGTSFSAEAAFKLPTNGYNLKRMPSFGVEADTDTSANNLTVRYSDDNSSSYAALATIDLTQQKKMAYRGGAFRERHIQLVSNNARPVRLHNFIAQLK